MTDKTSGARPSELQAGAAFLRDRSADLRRAMTSRRARHVWTGAVALAVTGGVLVSASASVPVTGTAASGTTRTVAPTTPSGTRHHAVRHDACRQPARRGPRLGQTGQSAAAGTDGVTVSQVLAVLDRAERRLQSSSPNPHIAQAAAELGMLYTTYQAQRLALDGADEQPRDESETADPASTSEESGPAGNAEPPAGATSATPVLRFVTDKPSADALAVSRPRAERHDSDHVTYDEVALAAMRLANLLDPSVPTALVEWTVPDAEFSLRESLLDVVACSAATRPRGTPTAAFPPTCCARCRSRPGTCCAATRRSG